MTQTQFTFIALFAGIRGFRLALETCGRKCVFSSEINPYCRHIYYKNFGEFPFGDIKKSKLQPFLNMIFYVQVFLINL